MSSPALETVQAVASAVRQGASCRPFVERALARADRAQPVLNCFTQLWHESALREADTIDRRQRPAGRDRPLLGVPIAVKEAYDVEGRPTTGCCDALEDRIAVRDAVVVERLRDAGAILIGKTNQHELSAGGTSLVSSHGAVRNPWDTRRGAGGSSGGSAAAVGAGILPAAVGSDTGGSVRIPAAFCGVFGLKPSNGSVPTTGLLPLAAEFDCPGPLAGTVGDLTLLYEVMSGGSRRDRLPGTDVSLRVGVPAPLFEAFLSPDVQAAMESATEALAAGGATLVPMSGRGIDDAREVWDALCLPLFADAFPELVEHDRVAPSVRKWLAHGRRLGMPGSANAQRRRTEISAWFMDRLRNCDVVLLPTTPYAASPADLDDSGAWNPDGRFPHPVTSGYMTSAVNIAGLPAVAVPVWLEGRQLPLSVTFVGPFGGEWTVLEAAHFWVEASGWRPRVPASDFGA